MSSDHQKPLAAFLVVTLACGMFMAFSLRHQDIAERISATVLSPVTVAAAEVTLDTLRDGLPDGRERVGGAAAEPADDEGPAPSSVPSSAPSSTGPATVAAPGRPVLDRSPRDRRTHRRSTSTPSTAGRDVRDHGSEPVLSAEPGRGDNPGQGIRPGGSRRGDSRPDGSRPGRGPRSARPAGVELRSGSTPARVVTRTARPAPRGKATGHTSVEAPSRAAGGKQKTAHAKQAKKPKKAKQKGKAQRRARR